MLAPQASSPPARHAIISCRRAIVTPPALYAAKVSPTLPLPRTKILCRRPAMLTRRRRPCEQPASTSAEIFASPPSATGRHEMQIAAHVTISPIPRQIVSHVTLSPTPDMPIFLLPSYRQRRCAMPVAAFARPRPRSDKRRRSEPPRVCCRASSYAAAAQRACRQIAEAPAAPASAADIASVCVIRSRSAKRQEQAYRDARRELGRGAGKRAKKMFSKERRRYGSGGTRSSIIDLPRDTPSLKCSPPKRRRCRSPSS